MLSYLLNQEIGKEFWKKLIIKTYLSAEIIIYNVIFVSIFFFLSFLGKSYSYKLHYRQQ